MGRSHPDKRSGRSSSGRNRRSRSRKVAAEVDALGKVFFFPDSHIPNEHSNYDVAVRACKQFAPDTVVLLGDWMDAESLKSHAPTKPGIRDFQEELDYAKHRLDELDNLPSVKRKVYIMGNHEWRLERYLAERAPALFKSVNLDALLGLTERGWVSSAYHETFKLGKLNVTHDTGSAGLNAHRSAATDHMGSTVIGHTHRMAYEVRGKLGGEPYLAAMFGWLGDPKKVDYLHQAKAAHWTHGFGLGYVQSNGVVHVVPVPIIRGECVVEGRLVR